MTAPVPLRVGLAASVLILGASEARPAVGDVLTSESFSLPAAPGNAAADPYVDMIVNTSPLTAWGRKGAVGLQGPQAIFPGTGGYVNTPAATVAFKFNVGAAVDALNAAYGAGKWTIASPRLTFQYTYYASNPIFGGGAGSFETYWVANDSWAFGNGSPSGNAYSDSNFVSGKDPAYAPDAASLLSWAGSDADLGSTTYNWLSPASNPHYTTWSTDKAGFNQGMLTANLANASGLARDVTSATAASNPNVSFYLIPNDPTLGLTIFTGGGNVTPQFSFDVISVPEPACVGALAAVAALLATPRRRAR